MGKELLGLRVEEDHTLWSAFIRNLTKIHWGLLLLDVLIGIISGDHRRKVTDIISQTRVVRQRYMNRGGRGEPIDKAGLGISYLIFSSRIFIIPHITVSSFQRNKRC